MKLTHILSLFIIITLSSCARDLSMNTYTSDSVLSLTLEGKVISAREVTIKNSDKIGDGGGTLAGGAAGALLGVAAEMTPLQALYLESEEHYWEVLWELG